MNQRIYMRTMGNMGVLKNSDKCRNSYGCQCALCDWACL